MGIEELRRLYETAVAELHARADDMEAVAERIADAQTRAAAGETVDVDALERELGEAQEAFDDAEREASRCRENLAAAEARERALDEHPLPEPRRHASPRGARQEPVYRPDTPERSFFADAYRYQFNFDPLARERLEAHGREMLEGGFVSQRDVGTGAFAGLTVPQYLIELFAPLARAGAPLLGAVRKLPLPAAGMTVNVSRLTTGAAVAAQASENDAVQETNADDTLLTINVRTYAGQQDVSRQALERSEMVDAVVFQDLIADYFTKLDSAIINADGTSGTHLGIRSTGSIIAVSYTDASPTVAEAFPKIADAIQQVNGTRFLPPTTIVMHPRRWGWFTAALDSQSRPLVVPNSNGPFNALAVGEAAEYGNVVGTLHGLPVITDANLPTNLGAGTNEDLVLVERVPDLLFWQEGDGSPRQFRFEQANAPQTIRLAVWGYSAFTAGRYPAASATIGGTGLVTPTF